MSALGSPVSLTTNQNKAVETEQPIRTGHVTILSRCEAINRLPVLFIILSNQIMASSLIIFT